jgi:hypothetical protein
MVGIEAQKALPQAIAICASAIDVPGWPDFACCTAFIAKVRMVLTHNSSIVSFIASMSSPAAFTHTVHVRK